MSRIPAGLLIDESDRHLLGPYAWRLDRDGYVFRMKYFPNGTRSGGKVNIRLHRFILGAEKGQVVDHINGNRLDNRRCNLRFVTIAENTQNMRPRSRSGVLGVHWNANARKWQVGVKRNGKSLYFGLFESLDEAAKVARAEQDRLSPGIVVAGRNIAEAA